MEMTEEWVPYKDRIPPEPTCEDEDTQHCQHHYGKIVTHPLGGTSKGECCFCGNKPPVFHDPIGTDVEAETTCRRCLKVLVYSDEVDAWVSEGYTPNVTEWCSTNTEEPQVLAGQKKKTTTPKNWAEWQGRNNRTTGNLDRATKALRQMAYDGEYDQGDRVIVDYDSLVDALDALEWFLGEPGCGDGCSGCIYCELTRGDPTLSENER